MPRVDYEKLSERRVGEPSETIQARVEKARELQRRRFSMEQSKSDGRNRPAQSAQNQQLIACNADMTPAEVRQFCDLDDTCRSLVRSAMSVHASHAKQISARAYHRVLKLARTIADLAGAEIIGPSHLAEALQYNPSMSTSTHRALTESEYRVASNALRELEVGIKKLYLQELPAILIYGSYARGQPSPESDIDILLLVSHDIHPGEEIRRVNTILADLNLRYSDSRYHFLCQGEVTIRT